jgi:hypothetical protein
MKRIIVVLFDNTAAFPISWGIEAVVEHNAAKTEIININP